MKKDIRSVIYCLCILWLMYFIIYSPYGIPKNKKVKYCVIDSIGVVESKEHEIVKENGFCYRTNCGNKFLTKKVLKIGDSVETNTIFVSH